MGVIAEMMSDEKGLIWHTNIAPYAVYLASIGDVTEQADALYEELKRAGIEVLYDDRDARPGDKFADSDLMGIPIRIVLSERTMAENTVEVKVRTEDTAQFVNRDDISHYLEEKISV
jgi:prolyl-tRNA synthetase